MYTALKENNSSTNQEMFKKYLYNQTNHYDK